MPMPDIGVPANLPAHAHFRYHYSHGFLFLLRHFKSGHATSQLPYLLPYSGKLCTADALSNENFQHLCPYDNGAVVRAHLKASLPQFINKGCSCSEQRLWIGWQPYFSSHYSSLPSIILSSWLQTPLRSQLCQRGGYLHQNQGFCCVLDILYRHYLQGPWWPFELRFCLLSDLFAHRHIWLDDIWGAP